MADTAMNRLALPLLLLTVLAACAGGSITINWNAWAWPVHGTVTVPITCNALTGAVTNGSGPCFNPVATCNGIANDAIAFASFNTWALANQGSLQVQLTIPNGSNCLFITADANMWTTGINNLVVVGYGASITSQPAGGFALGGRGLANNNLHSARLVTATAGSSCVTLVTAGLNTRFTVGQWSLITGFDLQSVATPQGYPPNMHYFEYVKISSINAGTGVVCFTVPLVNTYLSTWPNYNSGSNLEIDPGGPATLYALDPSWNTQQEYQGLTIDQGTAQTNSNGRDITYRDVTFVGSACGIPSQNLRWRVINGTMTACGMEVDKLVTEMVIDNTIISQIVVQSSSIDVLTVTNSNITSNLNGTPKRAHISDTTINNFNPGATAYGRTDEVICTNCVLTNIGVLGVLEKGFDEGGVNVDYTMSGGIITVPNSVGAQRWAVPGSNLYWTAILTNETSFRVLSVTQDATNTFIQTSLSGGFPSVPLTSGKLYIHVHPAPKFTCTNCTGSADAVDLSQAPAANPIYSYSKRTYTQTLTGAAPGISLWGTVVSYGVNVTAAYAGAGALTLHGTGQFDNYPVLKASDYSSTTYGPNYNVKIAGNRVTTSSGVTGTQSGDSGLAFPETLPANPWFTGSIVPFISADVSAAGTFSVTIEVTTDQGVVSP